MLGERLATVSKEKEEEGATVRGAAGFRCVHICVETPGVNSPQTDVHRCELRVQRKG